MRAIQLGLFSVSLKIYGGDYRKICVHVVTVRKQRLAAVEDLLTRTDEVPDGGEMVQLLEVGLDPEPE
jgi:hypothetical protein